MPNTNWLHSLIACLTGVHNKLPPATPIAISDTKASQQEALLEAKRLDRSSGGLPDILPLLWAWLNVQDRLNLRLCCREARRIHDSLVTSLCVCDEVSVLSSVSPARLSRISLPTCRETATDTGKALRGVISRGCHPHVLLLCLSGGNERRRHEQGLSVLCSLAEAPHELSVVHLAGVPLTPQVARALKSLFQAASHVSSLHHPQPQPYLIRGSYPNTISAPIATTGSITAAPAVATQSLPVSPALLPPLRLHLYGYDLTRGPAAAALEVVVSSAAPRLTRLELWGCVGWPKRLGPALQANGRLHHLTVSLQPLVVCAGGSAAGAAGRSSSPAAAAAWAAAAASSGAVASFGPVAAAATAYDVVHSIGTLRQLRCLELRGLTLNLSRPGSGSSVSRGSGSRAPSKAAAARKALDDAAPTPQQLACALFQLTALTRLVLDGLSAVNPLLATLSALSGLRSLELPDVAAGPQDLAALAQAAPRVRALTLAAVGQGAVLGLRDAGERAAVAAARPPEPLVLPAELEALRVVRDRPTLRTMRALKLTLGARARQPQPNRGSSSGGDGGGGGGGAAVGVFGAGLDGGSFRLAVVVPGIEIDMPDVEFDPLMAFHRSEDGVMRSTLLPESARALAAAVRMLAPPPPATQLPHRHHHTSASPPFSPSPASPACGPASWPPSPSASSSPCSWDTSTLGPHAAGPYTATSGGCGGGARGSAAGAVLGARSSNRSSGGLGGGGILGSGTGVVAPGWTPGEEERGGGAGWYEGGQEAEAAVWQQELVIHNVQGSLEPPPAAADTIAAADVDVPAVLSPPYKYDNIAGHSVSELRPVGQPLLTAVGHAVWILELRRLGLRSLELYGIGLGVGDLRAVASLGTLRRLALVSGELAAEGLPCLTALPLLEQLELSRCTPRRRAARHSTASGGGRSEDGAARELPLPPPAGEEEGEDEAGDETGAAGRRALLARSKRALLELCVRAPALRRVLVVRSAGADVVAQGPEGPLGAEWVRRQLRAMGPRQPGAGVQAQVQAGVAGSRAGAAGSRSVSGSGYGGLCRPSGGSEAVGAGAGNQGWPEVCWE